MEEAYDYIIVGGGTAGLVVAARLSEDASTRVAVIEAGGDKSSDPLVSTPNLMTALYGKQEYGWSFISTPQPSLNGRTIPQPRGRMLGGTSSLNYSMLAYPSKASLDAWSALGNEGWNYDVLAPYFRKFANTHPPSQNAKEFCRIDETYSQDISDQENGPVSLSYGHGFGPSNAAWFDAFDNLGLKMKSDPRTEAAIGAFQHAATIDPATRTRVSSASAYLTSDARSRENLTILTNTLVTKIVLEAVEASPDVDLLAKGVHVQSPDGSVHLMIAEKEVILAAGALHTPQILELSGIGGREILEKHGVPVLIDNPNVGEHLQDHPLVPENFEVVDGVATMDLLRDPAIMQAVAAQYQASRDGPLGQHVISSAYISMGASCGTWTPEARRQLLDKHLGDTTKRREAERRVIRGIIENEHEATYHYIFFPGQITILEHPAHLGEYLVPCLPQNCVVIMTSLNHPFSRGSCHILSPNIHDKPVWEPNYNQEKIDLELLARGVLFSSKMAATEPLRSLFKQGGKHTYEGDNLDEAREVVRRQQVSVYHLCSSAAMMPREAGGVVDARLRVYGVKNLRVVDASMFPLQVRGNIQSTVYAVAERAADIIKEDKEKG
ncbi:hypothetical protein CDD82_4077 [Ophiocordyceps australis]|uniref:Glucose-methanol-choline oxidoreductase N-terminal domain-containing protein n=1 Tax=Ophiocordyceps australis TaxID=1399860 RepID=A0A2C5XLI4_9HYPO|nr:hypothetical protein CDD82_4077 [Ophiocordyceps australis]